MEYDDAMKELINLVFQLRDWAIEHTNKTHPHIAEWVDYLVLKNKELETRVEELETLVYSKKEM